MQKSDVLVIGTSLDPHIDAVLSGLTCSVRVQRLDVDFFPNASSISLDTSPQAAPRIAVEAAGQLMDLDSVDICWFRRLGKPGIPETLSAKYQTFALNESNHVLESLVALIPEEKWLNSFFTTRKASLKPYQYVVAQECGLSVPPTLITNNLGIIESRWDGLHRGVAKTLSAPVISDSDGTREYAFTRRLISSSPPTTSELRCAPIQFQELIEPMYEVRITTVGDKHFATRLTQRDLSNVIRDWRSEYSAVSYAWIEIPEDIEFNLTKTLQRLDLQYAASDFIVDRENKWWFLEANPHGAWLWLEEALKDNPITREFQSYLLKRIRSGHDIG